MPLTDINRITEVFILGKISNSKQNCKDRDPKIGGEKKLLSLKLAAFFWNCKP